MIIHKSLKTLGLLSSLSAFTALTGCGESGTSGPASTLNFDSASKIKTATAATLTDTEYEALKVAAGLMDSDYYLPRPDGAGLVYPKRYSDFTRECSDGGTTRLDSVDMSAKATRTSDKELQTKSSYSMAASAKACVTRSYNEQTSAEENHQVDGKIEVKIAIDGIYSRDGGVKPEEESSTEANYSGTGSSSLNGTLSIGSTAKSYSHEIKFDDFGLVMKWSDEMKRDFEMAKADPLDSKGHTYEFFRDNLGCKGGINIGSHKMDCASLTKRFLMNHYEVQAE